MESKTKIQYNCGLYLEAGELAILPPFKPEYNIRTTCGTRYLVAAEVEHAGFILDIVESREQAEKLLFLCFDSLPERMSEDQFLTAFVERGIFYRVNGVDCPCLYFNCITNGIISIFALEIEASEYGIQQFIRERNNVSCLITYERVRHTPDDEEETPLSDFVNPCLSSN